MYWWVPAFSLLIVVQPISGEVLTSLFYTQDIREKEGMVGTNMSPAGCWLLFEHPPDAFNELFCYFVDPAPGYMLLTGNRPQDTSVCLLADALTS